MWAVARLKPEERLVITLMELEEKSVREIAGLTGWTEVNVKVRAWRARLALKRILEETGHER
jgi:RNA polymerase sigma-70 factor (ECF subfamily)